MAEEFADDIIRAPKTVEFGVYRCGMCGAGGVSRTWDQILHGSNNTAFDLRYCSGNREPVEMHEDRSSPILVVGPEGAEVGHRERPVHNQCAGITRRHLHVRCQRCGASFLMDVIADHRKLPRVKTFRFLLYWFFYALMATGLSRVLIWIAVFIKHMIR